MAYCRWGWDGSDVYIYESGSDDKPYLVCCTHGFFDTFGDLMRHVDEDRAKGLHVPAYVDERIAAEIASGASTIPTGEIPTERVPDPGPQRPEPELFTLLKQRLSEAREDRSAGT